MVDVPERIWAASVTENYGEWQTTTDGLPRPTEYVRADLHAALEAENARLKAEVAAVKEMYAREGAKALYELERAERAEARLAEALKALEQAEQQLDYGQVNAAHRIIIRAIEAQGGE